MKKTLTALIFGLTLVSTYAQVETIDKYDWEKSPKLHDLTAEEAALPEVILKDKLVYDFTYNDKGELECTYVHHVIIRVNSDDAISDNNKLYLPYYDESDMIRQKVRVINSKGEVKTLGERDVKESVDEESQRKLKYFALEGVDLGSEIEYFFLLKESPELSGSRSTLQGAVLKKNVEFKLISPPNLVFAFKSYNGLPDVALDSANNDVNIYSVSMPEIKGLAEEDFANVDANEMFLVYKLQANKSNNKSDFYRYGKYAEDVYAAMYGEISGGTNKKLQKLIKAMDLKLALTEEDKIRAIEQYIKTNFNVIEFYIPQYSDLEGVLDGKIGTQFGILRLYVAIFQSLGIEHQIAITTNRFDERFDKDFESYSYLDEYLIYFPDLNMHMEPSSVFSRLGFITSGLQYNYAVYIKPVEVGDFKTAVAKINFIDALPYDKTQNNISMDVDLSKDIDNPLYTLTLKETGYYAQSTQVVYDYLDEDNKKEVSEAQVKQIAEKAEDIQVTLENAGGIYFGLKPLVTKATFHSSQFVEKAGNQYLFNIGLLIGPQAEIYQEKERVLEVENGFNRWYHRELTFVMPEGYKCTNLDDLKIDVFQEKDGERTMTFTSNYTVTGNTVKVVIDEYYKVIVLPVSEYEDYRKVINAAANFNKVSLILEPQ